METNTLHLMVARTGLPMYEKGDVVTINNENQHFGLRVTSDPRFKTIKVTGISKEEAETLMSSVMSANFKIIHHRAVKLDVDYFDNKSVITNEELLLGLVVKDVPVEGQPSEVVV